MEIRNAIEKMLRAELERNLSADLNRPVEQVSVFCDKVCTDLYGFMQHKLSIQLL